MTPALTEYRKFYPQTPLNFYQEDLIGEVTDLKAWKETLQIWAGNGYRAESVFKMMQLYGTKALENEKNAPWEPIADYVPDEETQELLQKFEAQRPS